MEMAIVRVFLILTLSFLSTACVPDVRPETYSIGSVGQVNRSVSGVIISARGVTIDGSRGGGAAAGAAIGAIAGSQVGGGDAASAAAAIGGLVVGTIAGAASERKLSGQLGMEYVVETSNGNLMTIVQGAHPAFTTGQKVLVLYSSPARVIEDPRN